MQWFPLLRASASAAVLFLMATSECLAANEGEIKIVTFGTSLTAAGGWPQALRRDLEQCLDRPVQVLNLAKSGMASDWGLSQLDRVIAAAPDVVLIEFSINDAAVNRFISPSQSRTNIREMVSRLKTALPQARLFLMSMSPAWGLRGWVRPWLNRYYQIYQEEAAQLSVGFIDHRPSWAQLGEDKLKMAIPDGLHPRPEVDSSLLPPAIVTAIAKRDCSVH